MTVPTEPVEDPTLEQIGAYVPDYTVEAGVGNDVQTGTFSGATTPTDVQVRSLRDDALAWVQASAGTLVGVGVTLGGAVAALRTAAMIVLSTPPGDVARAEAMLRQADAALASLVEVNEAAGGTPPSTASTAVPYWNIPPVDTGRARYFNGRPLL